MSKKDPTSTGKSPKLTVPEIIDYCKNNLGITFNLMDEEKAKDLKKTISSSVLNSTVLLVLSKPKAENTLDLILGILLNFLPLICFLGRFCLK